MGRMRRARTFGIVALHWIGRQLAIDEAGHSRLQVLVIHGDWSHASSVVSGCDADPYGAAKYQAGRNDCGYLARVRSIRETGRVCPDVRRGSAGEPLKP